jgi:hypothetical protein
MVAVQYLSGPHVLYLFCYYLVAFDELHVTWNNCRCFMCRYIKEGSTVSVMGVVQRNDNVLMIVPPPEPITTGCQWAKCIFPASLEGIVLRCQDTSKNDVIPV